MLDARLRSESCRYEHLHFLAGLLRWQIRCIRGGTEVGFGCDGPKSEIPLGRQLGAFFRLAGGQKRKFRLERDCFERRKLSTCITR